MRTWRKGNPRTLTAGLQTGAARVQNGLEGPLKTDNRTTIWPRNSTSGIYLHTFITLIWKDTHTPCVHGGIIDDSQTMETTQVPINRQLDRKDSVHVHNGIRLSHKKKEILPLATTRTGLKGTMLSDISQRKTQTIWSHSYVESKEQSKQNRNIHTYREPTDGWGLGEGKV